MAHTPGPWEARSRGLSDNTLVIAAVHSDPPIGRREIAVLRPSEDRRYGPSDDEDQANARLMAAAPALLAACKLVADRWERGDLAEAARACAAAVDQAEA